LIQLIIVITNQSSKENLHKHLNTARTSIEKEKEGGERESSTYIIIDNLIVNFHQIQIK